MAKGKRSGRGKAPATANPVAAEAEEVVEDSAPLDSPKGVPADGAVEYLDSIWPLTLLLQGAVLVYALYLAYDLRTIAIREYGTIIHEFDPWFNFRATKYLNEKGWHEFFHWFDYQSWYPLGRPIGTTIYPGMQIVAVGLYRAFGFIGVDISLNDVCAYIPAWFGVIASAVTGLTAYECSKSKTAGVVGAFIMAQVPAHMMRSIGGGFDNESVVMTFMVLTYYFHVRSLRDDSSWWFGIFTGLSYAAATATWGGHIFVLNLVGAHTAGLVLLGRYSSKLHKSYSLFYIIGTAGAIRVPIVGMAPLKSLEQIGPLGVFCALQLLEFCEMQRKKRDLSFRKVMRLRFQVFGTAGGVLLVFAAYLWSLGYFGPLSSRVRGIFFTHVSTGNPLVDSVSEHQAASPGAFFQYLHYSYGLAPIGFVLTLLPWRSDAKYFLTAYAIIAWFVSTKMVRLMILTGPIASCLAGLAVGLGLEWSVRQILVGLSPQTEPESEENSKADLRRKRKLLNAKENTWMAVKMYRSSMRSFWQQYQSSPGRLIRKGLAILILLMIFNNYKPFMQHSAMMANSFSMSGPVLVRKAQLQNGETVTITDYPEAYKFLRENTPNDSRVMAWWDYGYQITGIGERTSIADGNTWNHEHIATLGLCLASPEKQAHRMIRHLADYVLVWSGGGGDDIAKSPHIARIANSVYPGLCSDPLCSTFGFYHNENGQQVPTPMMERSLLFKLVGANRYYAGTPDRNLFKEVFTSKYGLVRIYKVLSVSKKSKEWLADPANRLCDVPGSWYCPGQYPPALDWVIKKKRDFSQLEDFNVEGDESASQYHKEYTEHMERVRGRGHPTASQSTKQPKSRQVKPSRPRKAVDKSNWQDSEFTSALWQLVANGDLETLTAIAEANPTIINLRASDGRTALHWAYEFGHSEVVEWLLAKGADAEAQDKDGLVPSDFEI